jgi:hypothetical protein
MPVAEVGPTAARATGSAIQTRTRGRRAATAVSAGRQALTADLVPAGPRVRRAARPGVLAERVTNGDRSAPSAGTARRQPSGHPVQPLISVGMPTTAAAMPAGQGATAIGRGEVTRSRGVATVATAVTTPEAAITARGGARTAATTVGQAAPAALRPGRTGMFAAQHAGCPAGRTRPGQAGARAPVAATLGRPMARGATTEHSGLAGPVRSRAWTSPTASPPSSLIREPWRSCALCPVIWLR